MRRSLILLAFLALGGCKQSAADSSVAESGGADSPAAPVCQNNNGRGFGALTQCGAQWCAKDDNGTLRLTCTVNDSDPCIKEMLATDIALGIDTTQPIVDVGGKTFYNICPQTANKGAGYGAQWSCGAAKCAHIDTSYKRFCAVALSGGAPARAGARCKR